MKKNNHKYIFVVGAVMSGVGKGVTTASIGTILQAKGFNVSLIKADPYLNVDAGTMNPTEHGEVFVMESGLETDQDMGNYERFLNKSIPSENYMTNGMIFKYVIDKERALGYKGKCVEPVFHITEEIHRRIKASVLVTKAEITIIEIGGTVGEYQNAIFIEAARILKIQNIRDVMIVMVTYVPIPSKIGEMKTKPTQNAVRQLNSYGLNPDIIVARSEFPLDQKRKEKISIFCNIPIEHVISAPDIDSIYDVPVNFENDGLSETILKFFGIKAKQKDLIEWRKMVAHNKNVKGEVKIAVVGKYFETGDYVLSDAYLSVIEAIKFSSFKEGVKSKLTWINSKDYENGKRNVKELIKFDGVIVPGGFGENGVEGLVNTIRFARENKIPYFGLCYGMQLMVIEYARNVLGLRDANTAEINKNSRNLVINTMAGQDEKMMKGDYGATMRLGTYEAILKKNSIAYNAYGKEKINERHRHRYEVNTAYVHKLIDGGLVFSGMSPDGSLMEIAELPVSKHPFFLGTQFHPEFNARALAPHPLFTSFIKSAIKRHKK